MLDINLFDPSVREDPFSTYATMRTNSPVARIEPGGLYALSRYADVAAAFRDTQTYSSQGFGAVLCPKWIGHYPLSDSILLMDPPDHSRNRALVSRAFVSEVLARLEPMIEAVATELLDAPSLRSGEELDIVQALSSPLAGAVITQVLGLSPTLAPRLSVWTANITKITPVEPPPEIVAELQASLAEEQAYLNEVIDDRLATPRNDLPGTLCQAELDGERLPRSALLSFMFLLVNAGFETTMHLVSTAVLLFGRQPELLTALRKDPNKIPNFVEELLRYDGPVHMLMRLTTREVSLHGETIPAHSVVGLLVGAASRDPEHFEQPERFDIDRKIQGNLGFGHGPHVCIGAALARMEATICMRVLVERYDRIEINEGPRDWVYALHVRGLNSLPVRMHRAS